MPYRTLSIGSRRRYRVCSPNSGSLRLSSKPEECSEHRPLTDLSSFELAEHRALCLCRRDAKMTITTSLVSYSLIAAVLAAFYFSSARIEDSKIRSLEKEVAASNLRTQRIEIYLKTSLAPEVKTLAEMTTGQSKMFDVLKTQVDAQGELSASAQTVEHLREQVKLLNRIARVQHQEIVILEKAAGLLPQDGK